MRELDKVLDNREKIIWEGQPQFWPFILGSSVPSAIFGLFWLAVISPFIFAWFLIPATTVFFIVPLAFSLIGLWAVFGTPVYLALVHKYTYYAITDKRVIIQKGLIGRDFDMLDFDKITNAEVNVGVFDKLVGKDSGSLKLTTAGTFVETKQGPQVAPKTLANITKPYEVFRFFKNIEHDVKTDIEYPNKYRPRTNTGYRTKYSSSGSKKSRSKRK